MTAQVPQILKYLIVKKQLSLFWYVDNILNPLMMFDKYTRHEEIITFRLMISKVVDFLNNLIHNICYFVIIIENLMKFTTDIFAFNAVYLS